MKRRMDSDSDSSDNPKARARFELAASNNQQAMGMLLRAGINNRCPSDLEFSRDSRKYRDNATTDSGKS